MAQGVLSSLSVCVVVLVWGPTQRSGTTVEGTTVEVPFELHQQHLVVAKGSVGHLSHLNLLIDTGTIPSVVSRTVARKLRLETERSILIAFGKPVPIDSSMVDEFRIGSLSSGPVPVGIGDFSYLQGVRIDAIVGLDVLVRSSFSIDYRSRVLELAPAAATDAAIPLDVTWPFVTVRMVTAGYQLRLLVDTGSRDLVLFQARAADVLSNAPWRGDKTVHYASGPARLRRVDLRQVSLGEHRWDTLPGWALDRAPDGYPSAIDGVLGVMTLGCQRVRFDFDRAELGCTR